jgi:hypothetical protein
MNGTWPSLAAGAAAGCLVLVAGVVALGVRDALGAGKEAASCVCVYIYIYIYECVCLSILYPYCCACVRYKYHFFLKETV